MSATNMAEKFKIVKSILISQPEPQNKTPYHDLAKKYELKIDYRPFIFVEAVNEKEFRKQRIRLDEFPCVIFTSRNAIDNFFRLAEETRCKISPDTKYFCQTETIANYLQKFIIYRKRKVFVGTKNIEDLQNYFVKHREGNRFLLPISNLGSKPIIEYLEKLGIKYQESVMYKTLPSDLSDLADITYDVLVFFNALEIHSLYSNFPDFKQNETRLAGFGASTMQAIEERGLTINIKAPAADAPSMHMALDNYLQKSNALAPQNA